MAHAYCPEAITLCLQAGVHSVEHGNLLNMDIARQMAAQGTFFVPTLTVYDLFAKNGRQAGLDDFTLDKLSLVAEQGLQALEIAHQAGVNIASGSDIIGPFQEFKSRELILKASILGPMGALISATKTNAELLNVADRLGTVETGKLADLIVVDGNPLEDISLFEQALTRVHLVLKGGRIYKNIMSHEKVKSRP